MPRGAVEIVDSQPYLAYPTLLEQCAIGMLSLADEARRLGDLSTAGQGCLQGPEMRMSKARTQATSRLFKELGLPLLCSSVLFAFLSATLPSFPDFSASLPGHLDLGGCRHC